MFQCIRNSDHATQQRKVLTNSSDNDDDVEQRHENALERNLVPFSLLKDPTIGDGDYDFRTIVRQIRKTVEWSDP